MFGGLVVTVGRDGNLSIPVVDARTNSMAMALVGPKDRRNAVRWFVRLPTLEESERFPCPMGYDRKTIRFEPFLLYVDSPIPHRTMVSFHKVMCGSEVGKIDKTTLDRWMPTPQETIHWPALSLSIGAVAPNQVVELLGSSWWRKGPGKKRLDTWEIPDRGPQFEEQRILSVYCLVKMSWLPAQVGKTKFQFVPGKATHKPPVAPVDPRLPRAPAAPKEAEPIDPVRPVDPGPSTDG